MNAARDFFLDGLRRKWWVWPMAASVGFVVSISSWRDGARIQQIAVEGIKAQASVERISRKRTRSGTEYALDLAWTDTAGQPRKAATVSISGHLAQRILPNDKLAVDTLPVRYLPGETSESSAVLEDDAETQRKHQDVLTNWGIALSAVGLSGLAVIFFIRRRHVVSKETA
ncbi:hypothetical protein [Bosea sp. TND4EK4]|uniref:hypothetical protein n=1 Tax=Bosea sp. TND4EK4 TaxID=1907408 RepID=UPI0009544DBE|nr:hypothetical protein [Bosea sp. TND4EK4]SIQ73516.1 hypothetical protein SAMN05880592_10577 [Bosea sp. TND4EK4]